MATEFETKDDGKHDTFPTGCIRSASEGKGRFDLISPYALLRLAKAYERGGKQKGDRNWEQGFPVSRALDSALRHLIQRLMGDMSEDHFVAAAWNIFCAMDFEERIAEGKLPPELLDIPTDLKLPVYPEFGMDIAKPDATALPLLRSLLGFMQHLSDSGAYAEDAMAYQARIEAVIESHFDEVAKPLYCHECGEPTHVLELYTSNDDVKMYVCRTCLESIEKVDTEAGR